MTYHTPGPWKYDNDFQILSENLTKYGNWHICRVLDRYGQPDEVRDEITANANLIAAAPDLLRVLKDAEKFIKREYAATRTEDNYKRAILESVREAIAKAEGREV